MLSEAFLRRLDAMQLKMRSPAHGGAGGLRRSRALGSSVEFSDFREYAPGDDLRRVDWNAYARFERLFLKLFMEEQETQVNLLLDASASMDFGGKWQMAQELCQLLGYLALRGGDRVTVYVLREDETHCEPLRGRPGFMRLTQFLLSQRPWGETRLSALLPRLPLNGRGIGVLLSDLMSGDGYETALKALQYKKQETSVLQLLSPWELNPDLTDMVRLIDSETGEAREFTADSGAMAQYRRALQEMLHGAQAFCHARDMTYLMLSSGMDMEETALRSLSRAGLIG